MSTYNSIGYLKSINEDEITQGTERFQGVNIMSKKIMLFDPFISLKEEKSVTLVLKSGFWTLGAGIEQIFSLTKEERH